MKLIRVIKRCWHFIHFVFINFTGLIRLAISQRKNPKRNIQICENILRIKYTSDMRPFENLIREELSMAYSKYIHEITQGAPGKIISTRPLIKKWLLNNLNMYRHETKNISKKYLLYGINGCYHYLGKPKKSLKFLLELKDLDPQDEKIVKIIECRKRIIENNIDDVQLILANPKRFMAKFNCLKSICDVSE